MTYIERAIKDAVRAFPKGGIIHYVCSTPRVVFRGIRESVLHHYERVRLAQLLADVSPGTKAILYATATPITFDATAVFSAIEKLRSDYERLNLDGLADGLGITKEGVRRLIWLCAGVRDIGNGSEMYSAEMIIRVKSVLFEERISKQTTSLFDIQPSLTKNELLPTRQQWLASDYGISLMAAPFVGSAIAI